MKTHAILLVPEIFLLIFWLHPPVITAQITPPLGRLRITSVPPGASITVNDKPRPESTNVTLVVAPGREYKVSVTGGPGNLNCQSTCRVSPGQTVVIACTTNSPSPKCQPGQ